MKRLRTWVIALCFLGCGREKTAARLDGPFGTPQDLLQAAEERVDALCECADQPCRVRVMSAPDNPFGAAAVAPRARFRPAQRVQYAELMKRSVACATGQ
jgi:hypothetical protein